MTTIYAIALIILVVVIVYFLCRVSTLAKKIVGEKSEAFERSLSRCEKQYAHQVSELTTTYEAKIRILEGTVTLQMKEILDLQLDLQKLRKQKPEFIKHRSIYDPQEPSW